MRLVSKASRGQLPRGDHPIEVKHQRRGLLGNGHHNVLASFTTRRKFNSIARLNTLEQGRVDTINQRHRGQVKPVVP